LVTGLLLPELPLPSECILDISITWDTAGSVPGRSCFRKSVNSFKLVNEKLDMESFRIKKGEAALGEESIVLRESVTGYFSNLMDAFHGFDGLRKIGAVFFGAAMMTGAVSALVLFISMPSYLQLVLALSLPLSILTSRLYHRLRGFRKDTRIMYSSIEGIEFSPGTPGITCPHMILDLGDTRRLVVLPNEALEIGSDPEEFRDRLREKTV